MWRYTYTVVKPSSSEGSAGGRAAHQSSCFGVENQYWFLWTSEERGGENLEEYIYIQEESCSLGKRDEISLKKKVKYFRFLKAVFKTPFSYL